MISKYTKLTTFNKVLEVFDGEIHRQKLGTTLSPVP